MPAVLSANAPELTSHHRRPDSLSDFLASSRAPLSCVAISCTPESHSKILSCQSSRIDCAPPRLCHLLPQSRSAPLRLRARAHRLRSPRPLRAPLHHSPPSAPPSSTPAPPTSASSPSPPSRPSSPSSPAAPSPRSTKSAAFFSSSKIPANLPVDRSSLARPHHRHRHRLAQLPRLRAHPLRSTSTTPTPPSPSTAPTPSPCSPPPTPRSSSAIPPSSPARTAVRSKPNRKPARHDLPRLAPLARPRHTSGVNTPASPGSPPSGPSAPQLSASTASPRAALRRPHRQPRRRPRPHRTPRPRVDPAPRPPADIIRTYLTQNIHYTLDPDCLRTIEHFRALATQLGVLPLLPQLRLLG